MSDVVIITISQRRRMNQEEKSRIRKMERETREKKIRKGKVVMAIG